MTGGRGEGGGDSWTPNNVMQITVASGSTNSRHTWCRDGFLCATDLLAVHFGNLIYPVNHNGLVSERAMFGWWKPTYRKSSKDQHPHCGNYREGGVFFFAIHINVKSKESQSFAAPKTQRVSFFRGVGFTAIYGKQGIPYTGECFTVFRQGMSPTILFSAYVEAKLKCRFFSENDTL